MSEPAVTEIEGWGLGTEAFTEEGTTIMVHNEAITSFTVESSQTLKTCGIFRLLHHKTEVDGNILVAAQSMAGRGSATISLV